MTAKELKRIFSKGECLSLDAMRLYNDGKLNKKTMHEVEKHLLECNLCSGALDGLNSKRIAEVNKLSAHIQRRLAVYMNTPPRVPFFRRFGLVIISSAILLTTVGTWWYFSQDTGKVKPQVTAKIIAIDNQEHSGVEQSIAGNGNVPENPETTNPVVDNSTEKIASENFSGQSAKTQNLNPELPEKENPITVIQEPDPAQTNSTNPVEVAGPNTKTANSNLPLRIKSVQIYPAVTHNDKQGRKEAKDGQLGKPGNSSSSFELSEMPFFPGGTEALRNYIINNFKSPAIDRSKLTRYATGVMFVVNSKTGAISSPELSFGISPEIDKEILRVITHMPNWSPGKKRGEVDIMIGITFE